MTDEMTDEWIDISVPLKSGMVHWPDNPPVDIERVMDMNRGDICNVSKMSLGVHTGTHMDAPIHFLANGIGIDQMPLTAAMGRARVIEIGDPVSIKPGELVTHSIQRGERILFKTLNSPRCWQTDALWKTSSMYRMRPHSIWQPSARKQLAWTISPSAERRSMAHRRTRRFWRRASGSSRG